MPPQRCKLIAAVPQMHRLPPSWWKVEHACICGSAVEVETVASHAPELL